MMLTADTILREVARSFGVPVALLRSTARFRTASVPRAVAMYLCRCCLLGRPDAKGVQEPLSFERIGRTFGGRHHTTVLSACRKVQKWIAAADHEVNTFTIKQIIQRLQPYMDRAEAVYIETVSKPAEGIQCVN